MARRTKRPPSARPSQRCEARPQLPRAINFFGRRRTSLIHKKSTFFIVAIGRRCLCHRMLLVALITMVCSDMADCNASSRDCKSKSGAPWRRGARGLGMAVYEARPSWSRCNEIGLVVEEPASWVDPLG